MFSNVDITKENEPQSLFQLFSFHRTLLISELQLILEIRGTTRDSLKQKKKAFLISIIDWNTVNMFVTFKKPQMNFSEKPNAL